MNKEDIVAYEKNMLKEWEKSMREWMCIIEAGKKNRWQDEEKGIKNWSEKEEFGKVMYRVLQDMSEVTRIFFKIRDGGESQEIWKENVAFFCAIYNSWQNLTRIAETFFKNKNKKDK